MINLIVATQAEADPVISTLKLKKTPDVFNCYQKDATHLVISGIGKSNAASACGWLAHKTLQINDNNKTSTAWLNFGIAGHQTADLGEIFIAHKITDLATERVWFPHRLPNCTLPSSDLTTVDRPLAEYRPRELHDMEASAYIEAARKFSEAELVQVIKVVSDNEAQPLSSVTASFAKKLIENNSESILQYIVSLEELSQTIPSGNNFSLQLVLDHWRFSVSQTVQLERLLQRHNILLGPLTTIPDSLQQVKTSKEVLTWLQTKLDNTDCTL